jgi:hypothetical protein
MSGQLHNPAALLLELEPTAPIGWTQRRKENSSRYRDSNSDPWVVQSIGSRYTDYATAGYHEYVIVIAYVIKLLLLCK